MESPGSIFCKNNKISYHNYAKDTETYLTISSDDYSPMQALCKCLWTSPSSIHLQFVATKTGILSQNMTLPNPERKCFYAYG